MSKTVYDIITEIVIEKIESGVVPWHKPWKNYKDGELILHQNYVSKKPYSGINQFLLNCTPYDSPYWLSFKQIKDAGLKLRKGSKSFPVFYFRPFYVDENGEIIDIKDISEVNKNDYELKFMMKFYKVFNSSCVEGLEDAFFPDNVTNSDVESSSLDVCESLINNWIDKPVFTQKHSRAYYSHDLDLINLPKKSAFHNIEEYYSTAFHEMTHATGHEKRLNRFNEEKPAEFGDEVYSKEELVAEMGASMLCGITGIHNKTIDNSAAYIKGWLSKLKGDKKLVVFAASQAEKAVKFITENQAESFQFNDCAEPDTMQLSLF